MNGLFNPDNGWEAALLALISICGLAIAYAPVVIGQRNTAKKLHKIDTQVSNSHDENLRDEITRGFREIRQDIGGLREEIRTERVERIAGDKRREEAA
ncbi:minor tail protein [Mycobacterium phage Jeeves]|uniref:Minor tail protein n=1 Tax=Mycobacterium phage Jeeves TaxID=2652402 RepID=A0A5J6T8C8_9CAUD|nr:minor tail protein [Mycobacterium phage Jeeves]QFG04505.1 minor tail protein [Mycobacterium phage Jeeves]